VDTNKSESYMIKKTVVKKNNLVDVTKYFEKK
jgi:hypothetical protein